MKIFLLLSYIFYLTKAISISHCDGKISNFNKNLDHISLHYDFAPDADDLMSTGADRSMLETVYGKQFLVDRVSRVGGTYGTNVGSYYPSSIYVMSKVWDDVGGFLTAKGGDPSATTAIQGELNFFKNTIIRGGKIFIKEGGQSDFTSLVVKELEKWIPNSGKCVYVTQHNAQFNEGKTSSGIISYLKLKTVYQKISDGNAKLKKTNWRLNGKDFAYYTKRSKQSCVWDIIFEYFKQQNSFCTEYRNQKVDQSVCVDFSDTHELFWNLGIDNNSHTVTIDEFVQTYLKPVSNSEKMSCTTSTSTSPSKSTITSPSKSTITSPSKSTSTSLRTSPSTSLRTSPSTSLRTSPSTSPTKFKFVLQNIGTINVPINIIKDKKFNLEYLAPEKGVYTFILDKEDKNIYTRTEKITPYYLFGDISGRILYSSINNTGIYTVTIKETNDKVNFNIIS